MYLARLFVPIPGNCDGESREWWCAKFRRRGTDNHGDEHNGPGTRRARYGDFSKEQCQRKTEN